MPLAEVVKAICDRWDGQSLDDEISGGLHLGSATKGTDMPYCVLQEPTAIPVGFTSRLGTRQGTTYSDVSFRLVIHAGAGIEDITDEVEAVKTAFSNAPLSLSSATLLFARKTNERMVANPTDQYPNAVLWALEYQVQAAEAVDLNPS